jgi:hypothetical protein
MFNCAFEACAVGFMQKQFKNNFKLIRQIIIIDYWENLLKIVGLAILLYPVLGVS